jgi:hypothetical protein
MFCGGFNLLLVLWLYIMCAGDLYKMNYTYKCEYHSPLVGHQKYDGTIRVMRENPEVRFLIDPMTQRVQFMNHGSTLGLSNP